MHWRNLDCFPRSPGGWVARTTFGKRDFNDEKNVRKILARWNPYTTTLVSVPGNGQLLPALEIAESRVIAHSAFIKRIRISLILLLFSMFATLAAAIFQHNSKAFLSFQMLSGIGVFALFDYMLIIRNPSALAERALFAYHVRINGKVAALCWTVLMVLAGALQYAAESKMGTDGAIIAYGIYFPSLNLSGVWRLVIGPLLHANASHWFSNLVMLVIIGSVSGVISRTDTIALFFAGSIVGAMTSFLFAPFTHFDAYVGISAGITAMLGFCVGSALRRPEEFPQKFALTLMLFAIMDIYLAWIYAPNASNEGHIAGLIFGFFWSWLKVVNCKLIDLIFAAKK